MIEYLYNENSHNDKQNLERTYCGWKQIEDTISLKYLGDKIRICRHNRTNDPFQEIEMAWVALII